MEFQDIMNFFCKVSKKDFRRFCDRVQSEYYTESIFSFITTQSDGTVVTDYCLDDVEIAQSVKPVVKSLNIAQSVKPVGRRIEYYINPFWKEA